MLAAGIGGGNLLGIPEVVVGIDVVEEQNARLGKIIGRPHDGVPERARRLALIDPQPIFTTMGSSLYLCIAGAGDMEQLPFGIVPDRLHEGVAHADRDIEIVPAAF